MPGTGRLPGLGKTHLRHGAYIIPLVRIEFIQRIGLAEISGMKAAETFFLLLWMMITLKKILISERVLHVDRLRILPCELREPKFANRVMRPQTKIVLAVGNLIFFIYPEKMS